MTVIADMTKESQGGLAAGGCGCSGAAVPGGGGTCSCDGSQDVWASIADTIVATCVKVKPGEVVQLGGGIHAFPFIEALALAVRRAGGYPELNVTSQRLLNLIARETPLEFLARPPVHRLRWVEDVDAVIATDTLIDPDLLPALSPERQQALAAGWGPVEEAMAARGVRSLYVPFPSEAIAARYGLTADELQRRIVQSLDIDYEAVAALGARIAQRVAQAREARITGPGGTSITLTWGPSSVALNDGVVARSEEEPGGSFAELPAGVCVLTAEQVRADGRWAVPLAYWEKQPVAPLSLDFAEGRLEQADADRGKVILRPLLFQGRRRSPVTIGRLAFGFNPGVTDVTGYSLVDMRLNGSVSLILQHSRTTAEGMPYWEWPLVLPGASLWLDGEPVLEEGRWLV